MDPNSLLTPSDDFQLDGIICLVVKNISHDHTTMVAAIVPLLVPTVVYHQSSGRPKSLQSLSNFDPPHGITDGTNIRNKEWGVVRFDPSRPYWWRKEKGPRPSLDGCGGGILPSYVRRSKQKSEINEGDCPYLTFRAGRIQRSSTHPCDPVQKQSRKVIWTFYMHYMKRCHGRKEDCAHTANLNNFSLAFKFWDLIA